ncbi:MAG TPA: L,D-transpeptidase family protein, partial [Aquella sp.]|nr:L,D-transpeptidase family protein [Aquella sp.]
LRSLNVSVGKRIQQIELNMDRMRFLPDIYPDRYAIVNIPDYSMTVIEDGKLKLFSPVVVGKPNKQTCVLNSQISEIEINPFWNVPSSIASKETLPAVQADPKFLVNNDIKVFKLKDGKYSEINPEKVDWKKVKSSNLNYRFRQNPGDDNAMGKLKFKFANRCGIYLHDSPFPELFNETQRGFSHGCVRVGMPVDFATFLLSPNKGWDRQTFDAQLALGKQSSVKLSKPLQLYIIYLTAWYDAEEDFVQFRDDIYNFDKLSLYPVYMTKKKVQKSEDATKADSA